MTQPVLSLSEFLASSAPLDVQVQRAHHRRSSKVGLADAPKGSFLNGVGSWMVGDSFSTVASSKDLDEEGGRSRSSSFLGSIASCLSKRRSSAGPSLEALDVLSGISEDKYVKKQTLQHALETGDTILIKGSWLVDRWQEGKAGSGAFGLPSRQEIEKRWNAAIWNPDLLFRQQAKGLANIVAVSHCWLSSQHPDPQGHNMDVLCRTIDLMLKSTPLEDLALYIDYCSLYQLPRTVEQEATFTMASAQSHLWFLHQSTRVWMLTTVPTGAERNEAFDQRIAPMLERALGDMVTQTNFMLDLGKMDSTCTTWQRIVSTCKHQRQPPISPEAFEKQLQNQSCSDEDVRAFAVHKYQEGFLEVIIAAKELNFSTLDWTDKEARQLSAILPYCERLTKLALPGNKITEEGVRALLKTLPKCKSLQEMWVTQNSVSRAKKDIKEELLASWEKTGRFRDQLRL